jgi:hypothetical protein
MTNARAVHMPRAAQGSSPNTGPTRPLWPDWQRRSRFERSREPCARIDALTSASLRCVTAMGARSEDPRPLPSLGASGRL